MSQFVARASRVAAAAVFATLVSGAAGCSSPTSPTVHAVLQRIELRVGTGAAATSGKTLMVNYTGWLYDDTKPDKKGAQFDASPAGQPLVFQLGTGQVIEGWDVGLLYMRVGGLRRLIIPSDLAYGRAGSGSVIPPNASLVFEVELLSVAGG